MRFLIVPLDLVPIRRTHSRCQSRQTFWGSDWCASEWERAETGVRAGPFSCGNDLERASRRFATSGVEVYIMFGAAKKLDVRADVRSQAIVALPTHVRMVDSMWQRVVRRQTSLDFV